MSQTAQFLENPKRRSLLGRAPLRGLRLHLQLPVEVMRQNRRHHIQLIPQKTSDSYIIHLALRFQLPKTLSWAARPL